MSADPKIGLALGSGGARGLAHAGVLEVLEGSTLPIHCISGTSMGAIVGGLYAEYPKAAVTWRRLQGYINDDRFLSSWSPFVPKDSGGENHESQSRFEDLMDTVQRKLVALRTVTRPWQQGRERLQEPLENLFRARRFEDLKMPFAAVALDLISGRRVTFAAGDLIEGIYASSAIPAVFPPLQRDGMVITDGGAPFRCPVEACRELGADLVVAVDIPAFEETKYGTGLDMILRSNTIARQRLNRFVLATADLVIRPRVQDYHWADFRAGDRCRERGAEAAREALPELERLWNHRRSWTYRWRRAMVARLGFERAVDTAEVD